jgi:hypothetical protein
MNDAADSSTLLFFLVGVVVVIALQVAIIRWVFRINVIVALLKDILSAIRPQNLISTDISPLQLCEGCSRNFEKEKLKKITSGQMLCPECINNLKSKKAKKV